MIKRFTLLLQAILVMSIISASAQVISINFPVERAVFQRDLSNRGTIYLSGSIDRKVDSIRVQLTEYVGDEEQIYLPWKTINNQSVKGYFLDGIEAKGGWYKLEVESYLEGEIYARGLLTKVGVGEVLIISGQSNAQGVVGYGGPDIGAKDDRVNCADYYNGNFFSDPVFPLAFSHLDNNSNIGPMGRTPWIWGEVGDSLANRLGVPILFFNSALTGTLSYNWWQSSRNEPTFSAIFRDFFVQGYPYQNLKISLKQYASLLGVRAVLWHQGETDTAPGIPREDEIFGYYKELIQNTRNDYGSNVAWMFSKVSYSGGILSDEVINAQTRIINEPGFNIFEGPFTDTLQVPRPDGVHFTNVGGERGLGILAKAWLRKLDSAFFSTCVPIQEVPVAEIKEECDPSFALRLTTPEGYALVRWKDYNYENSRLVNGGIWSSILLDENQNYKLSTEINTAAIVFQEPDKPAADKDYLCEGETLELKADNRFESVVWMDSTLGDRLLATAGGEYSYVAQNGVGCNFNSAKLLLEQPEPPVALNEFGITANGVKFTGNDTFTYCKSEDISLSVDPGFDSYLWSDGLTDASRTADKAATYAVQASYGPGCQTPLVSLDLNPVGVSDAPIIFRDGIYELSAGTGTTSETIKWYKDGAEIASGASLLHVTSSGAYQAVFEVQSSDGARCQSALSNLLQLDISNSPRVIAYPNPVQTELNIESMDIQRNLRGFLTDASGRKVRVLENVSQWGAKQKIDVGSLSPGMYILYLETDKETHTQKISVQ